MDGCTVRIGARLNHRSAVSLDSPTSQSVRKIEIGLSTEAGVLESIDIDVGSAYIAAFMRNIDWSAVKLRYEDAVNVAPPRPLEQKEFDDVPSISVEEVRAMLKSGTSVQVIDTRPRHYTTKAQDIMDGAVWRDPERLDDWIGTLSKTEPVVTFCVYGFHIGCQTASTLRKAGFDARYMAGGHYAWKAIKGPVKLFE